MVLPGVTVQKKLTLSISDTTWFHSGATLGRRAIITSRNKTDLQVSNIILEESYNTLSLENSRIGRYSLIIPYISQFVGPTAQGRAGAIMAHCYNAAHQPSIPSTHPLFNTSSSLPDST